MNVKTLMKSPATTVSSETTLAEARARAQMVEPEDIPVIDGGTLAGLLLARSLRASSGHLDGAQPVRTVMLTPSPCVAAESSIGAAARLLSEHGLRSLPIVERGGLVGVVSSRDLLGHLVAELEHRWSPSATHGLVVCDLAEGDRELLAFARGLVPRSSGRLTLLHVVRPPLWTWTRAIPAGLLAPFTSAREGAACEQLKALIETDAAGLGHRIETGDPVRAIVSCAVATEADVVVASRGGLVDVRGLTDLARLLPCPFVVVPLEVRGERPREPSQTNPNDSRLGRRNPESHGGEPSQKNPNNSRPGKRNPERRGGEPSQTNPESSPPEQRNPQGRG
jgi:hypothetical protein